LNQNSIERKRAFKMLLALFFAFLLAFLLWKVGSFFIINELISTKTLILGILLVSIGFFGLNIYTIQHSTNYEAPKIGSYIGQVVVGITAIVVFLPIIVFIVIIVWKVTAYSMGKYIKLYEYSNYPCENMTFQIDDKMVLVTRANHYMQHGLYYVTRNTLENYSEYKNDPNRLDIEKNIYPKGSSFKVIGYYGATGSSLGFSQNYLVQSLEDNKSIAWISHWKFHVKECRPLLRENYYEDNLTFDVQVRGDDYQQRTIDISKMEMKPFE